MAMNRTFLFLLFFIFCAFVSCKNDPAQRIVDEAIQLHGGEAYESFLLEFDFRDRHYTAARNGGVFRYTREFTDSTGNIRDVLSNDGFVRYRDDSRVSLSKERAQAYTRSVNSVIYFALLPFGLNDNAVNKEWVEETIIRGQPYEVVRVTFDKVGGGEDHEDVFLYWFHRDKHTMDYFAYTYSTDGGGLRFRQAVNPRRKNGILLQDYINYRPDDESIPVDSLRSMFESGQLKKLSEIRMENAVVSEYRHEN